MPKNENPKGEESQKLKRDEKDLMVGDQNGRNILHRAAIEQQYTLIVDLVQT